MARKEAFRRQTDDIPEPGVNLVEERMLNRENEVRLRQAVDQLPPRQKLIFTLSRHKGLKHEEIAEELQISRNTVKTHLVQALKTLRGILHFW
jgi:RNA polymerase sigma-70 factor (ECF subfamily)